MDTANSKQTTRPTVLDLFAGAGGMSLGMEAAGFDIVGAVEIDPIHAAVHHFNFPYSSTVCADIASIDPIEFESNTAAEELDVIVGGPPCQGFSHIGKRQLEDPRNQLVFEYLRFVRALRPKYFVFENVPGIATGRHRQFLAELIQEFTELGYVIAQPYRIVDAADFGVPQNRKRLILVGSRHDVRPFEYPFGNFLRGHTTAMEAIGDLSRYPVFIDSDLGIPVTDIIHLGGYSNYGAGENGSFALCHIRTHAEPKLWGHIGSRHNETSIKRFNSTQVGQIEPVSRFYRLHPDRPSHTLRAGTASNRGAFTAPRPIHYEHPRCISVREAARLQSFPDWFQFHRTIWHGFRQIGNSVAPLLAKAIGDQLIGTLGIDISLSEISRCEPQDEALVRMNMREAADYFKVSRHTIAPRLRSAS